MSVIGHFIELSGIATTGISLIREHSVGFRPPRALWVPFTLGRPLGAPNEPAFQTEVLSSLLALLDTDTGPSVLNDFAKEAPLPAASNPAGTFGPANWSEVSPVNAAASKAALSDAAVIDAVKAEMAFLAPLHASWVGKPGNRSITGASGLEPEQIVALLGAVLSGGIPATLPSNSTASSPAAMFRLAGEEIRHWYVEAAMDSPSQNMTIAAIDEWFWGETACASLLLKLQSVLAKSDQKDITRLALAALIPRAQHHRLLTTD